MSDIVERARKIVELHGDTYSSYEVIGLLGQLADEIEQLRCFANDAITEVKGLRVEVERLQTRRQP